MTERAVAAIALGGMGLNLLGGCYLAYDLLGRRRGPLRHLVRLVSYATLYFLVYWQLFDWRFGMVAGLGLASILSAETAHAQRGPQHAKEKRWMVVFGLARGLVLGLGTGIDLGVLFGAVFGLLCGGGLATTYLAGFSVPSELETLARPHLSRRKGLAALLRGTTAGLAGSIASFLTRPPSEALALGLRVGISVGAVSALAGLFSPLIEWRAERLPARSLGLIGLALIVAGMALQSVQYWRALVGP